MFVIGKESLTQPGLERFEGKFEELSSFRNENNTGPILRIFVVKANTNDEDLMREYGNSMPHTKYGKTFVFFVSNEIKEEIIISQEEPFISKNLQPFVLNTYVKMPMGEARLTQSYSP